jgi:hypothetical protein
MSNKSKPKEYRGNFTSHENGLIVKNMVEAFEKKLSKSKQV